MFDSLDRQSSINHSELMNYQMIFLSVRKDFLFVRTKVSMNLSLLLLGNVESVFDRVAFRLPIGAFSRNRICSTDLHRKFCLSFEKKMNQFNNSAINQTTTSDKLSVAFLNVSTWNDVDSMKSALTYDLYQHLSETIVYKYICLTIFIIGVIGNFLSVLVFSRSSLRHRSCAVYFLALAITDIASLCASFVDTVLPSYNNLSLPAKSLFICKMNPFMIYFTADLSNYLLAVASIDRAVSIQYPLTSKRFCRARIAINNIILLSVVFLLVNGHILWGFEITSESNQNHCLPSKEKFFFTNDTNPINYFRFYGIFDSLDMLFAVVIPFIVMLICNVLILIRVLTSHRSIRAIVTSTIQSRKFRKRYEKEKQLTVMLLGSAAGLFLFIPHPIDWICS